MIVLLLKLALAIPIAVILAYIVREVIVYKSLEYYKKQGLKCIYLPVIGVLSLYSAKKETKDQLANVRKLIEDNPQEPMLVFNSSRILGAVCYILDEELTKELMIRETECLIKTPLMGHLNFGFFFDNGDKVFESRGIYGKFFNYQNLRLLSIEIRRAILRKTNAFSAANLEKGKWTKVALKDFLNDIVGEIVNAILFGEQKEHKIGDQPLHICVESYINGVLSILTDPLNIIGLDYPHSLSLLKKTKQNKELYTKLEEGMWKIYQSRLASGPVSTPNLVDLLIEYNDDRVKKGQEPLSMRDVAGHMILLQFAGADTSLEVSTGTVFRMAKEPKIQEDFLKVIRDVESSKGNFETIDYSLIEECETLDDYIQEFLRIYAPVPVLSNRDFIKDVSIGKYRFRKGDRATFMCAMNHTNPRFFPHRDQFKPEALKSIKSAPSMRCAFTPFGQGKRICIGKGLGEMVVKMAVSMITRNFEVMPDPDYEEVKVHALTYGLKNPSIMMRERQ
jgi:cytochrome P450